MATYHAENFNTFSRIGSVALEMVLDHSDCQRVIAVLSPAAARIAAENLLECAEDAEEWARAKARGDV